MIGFIGLGSMGAVLAGNLVGTGHDLVTHDIAGAGRSPDGASFVASAAELARRADVIVLSLPDGTVSAAVAEEIAATHARQVAHVLDTSTIGPSAAEAIEARLAAAGIGYVDAPVSGGIAGARARTLMVMYAGTDDAVAAVAPVLAGLSDRSRRVGARAGLAQALKLANNFLSAAALAATSEAVAFGVRAGLDMGTLLEVINASSGQSNASSEKFTKQVLTGRYAAGFANQLMAKDVRLYLAEVERRGGTADVGRLTASIWQSFAEEQPGVDFTAIYRFVTRTTT